MNKRIGFAGVVGRYRVGGVGEVDGRRSTRRAATSSPSSVAYRKDAATTRRLKGAMRGASDLPVHSINATAAIPGVDFSDHLNY